MKGSMRLRPGPSTLRARLDGAERIADTLRPAVAITAVIAVVLAFCCPGPGYSQSTQKSTTTTTNAAASASAPTPKVTYGSVSLAQAKQALAKLQGAASFAAWLDAYSGALLPAEGAGLLVEQVPKALIAARPGLLGKAGSLYQLAGLYENAADAFRMAADAAGAVAAAGTAATTAGASGTTVAAAALLESRVDWLLQSARCRLAVGQTQTAREVAALVVTAAKTKIQLDRATLISAWAFLVEGLPREAYTIARDTASGARKGSAERREALFVQWLAASAPDSPMSMLAKDLPSPGDPGPIRTALLAEFPDSAEAAIAAGKIAQAPVPWLSLSVFPQAAAAAAGAKPGRPGAGGTANAGAAASFPSSKPAPIAYLQTGWFSRKENAEAMAASLKAKGFKAKVDAQKTANGEDRWAVLVEAEGDWSGIQAKLKDLGYESYPAD